MVDVRIQDSEPPTREVIEAFKAVETAKGKISPKQKDKLIAELTAEMRSAAAKLEFEKAAYLRDRIKRIQGGEEI